MKIAYVYDAVYPWVKGGGEKRVYELSRRLAGRGHEVHCYGMKWWPGEVDVVKDGVYLHGVCKPMPLHSGKRRSVKEAAYFAGRLLTSLKEECDLVDCQEFPYLPCFSAKLLCEFKRAELLITWLEVWGDYWYEYMGRKGHVGKMIENAVSRLTDKNIAISERTKRGLEELGVGDAHVVPIGIDFKRIGQIEAAETASEIIYSGRLIGHKNVDVLIRALELVKREVPDTRTIIVGNGPENAKLKHLAANLGLEKDIRFTGFLENHDSVISLMKASKVFVMPSTREGFGIAALEANACGLPVITANHRMNAVCDLVKDGTGFVCELSAEEISGAIIQALDKSRSMKTNCVELARHYDWDDICDRIETIYEG